VATRDDDLTDIVTRERSRLRNFIRRRVRDPGDAEDILQDVFSALVEANRLLMPIDHITGWLYRVARKRITDLFRARTPEALELEDLLPSADASPEAEYARTVLFKALEQASGGDAKVPFLHEAAEVGIDPADALRSATGR